MILLTLSKQTWMYFVWFKLVLWVYAPCIVTCGPLLVPYPNLVMKLISFISWSSPNRSFNTNFGSFVFRRYTIPGIMRYPFICLASMHLFLFSTWPTSDVREGHMIELGGLIVLFEFLVLPTGVMNSTYLSQTDLLKGSLIYVVFAIDQFAISLDFIVLFLYIVQYCLCVFLRTIWVLICEYID